MQPFPPELELFRSQLEIDPLDADAARRLESALHLRDAGPWDPLRSVLSVLEGEVVAGSPLPRPDRIEAVCLEEVLTHPKEKAERQHLIASLAGRLLHLIEGDETARTIVRFCGEPGVGAPVLRFRDSLAGVLQVTQPVDVRVAAGAERVFTAMVDRSPVLVVHRDYLQPESTLSEAEFRFLVGRSLSHIRFGHCALLQLGPDRLENLILDQFPLLVKAPIKLAARAAGAVGLGTAVKKVGDWLPGSSAGKRAVRSLGDMLPEKGQETVLPESVHEWVRAWIQGVELTADRVGLVLSGHLTSAASGILRTSTALQAFCGPIRPPGLRSMILTRGETDRLAGERLRELLRFAVSLPYLSLIDGLGPEEAI